MPLPEYVCQFGKREKCLPRITNIDADGKITIGFPEGLKSVNNTEYKNVSKALRIELIMVEDEGATKRNATVSGWEVTEIKSDKLSVQVTFN